MKTSIKSQSLWFYYVWFHSYGYSQYAQICIFGRTSNSLIYWTAHNRTINFGSLPMFSWSTNMIKTSNVKRCIFCAVRQNSQNKVFFPIKNGCYYKLWLMDPLLLTKSKNILPEIIVGILSTFGNCTKELLKKLVFWNALVSRSFHSYNNVTYV